MVTCTVALRAMSNAAYLELSLSRQRDTGDRVVWVALSLLTASTPQVLPWQACGTMPIGTVRVFTVDLVFFFCSICTHWHMFMCLLTALRAGPRLKRTCCILSPTRNMLTSQAQIPLSGKSQIGLPASVLLVFVFTLILKVKL